MEGWYEDPAGRHEYRWFSAGRPTDLVMDAGKTSRDPISITDPSVYESLELKRPP
jgi:YD repeat-containing protein